MFGIGFMELCLIAVVALVFVGPSRLPEVMKQLSRVFVHMRHMSTEVRGTINQAMIDAEREINAEKAAKHIQEILQNPTGTETHEPAEPHSPDSEAAKTQEPKKLEELKEQTRVSSSQDL